jgi:hypothetical protein
MIDVKRYIDEGGSLEKLYAGKIGLDDIKYVPIPDQVVIPDRILN